MAVSPGGEEAGGRRKTEQLTDLKVHLDCTHPNISVVTNDLISVNAKKL